tara:strand:- start:7534 stop:8154 length:621 start_codon:yes stop_codon:yes gene_type:complete
MASILKADTVQTQSGSGTFNLGASGDTVKIAGGSPGADKVLTSDASGNATWVAPAGGGKILQVIQGFSVAGDTTTSTSFVTTPLTADITPVSTSNKILVSATFYSGYPVQNYSCIYTLYRDSTNLDESSGMGGFINAGNSSADAHYLYQGKTVAMQFLDDPSSTSAITYGVFFKANGGGAYFNVNRNDDAGAKGTAVIILQEVDGT